MDTEELTPIKEEIKRVLGDKIDDQQLENELRKYLDEYHISVDAAKRGIIRKYGGADITSAVTGAAVTKKIGDLVGNETNLDITAKVVFSASKDITVKGNNKTIISGILGDETGTVSFTIWEPGSIMLEKDAVYIFHNTYTKVWNDRVSVNIGNFGKVEPANGVVMDVPERQVAPPSECKIGEIRDGMGSVTTTGRIVSVENREVMVKGVNKTVYSGVIADDSGKIQFSAWNDFGLKEGETVRIENAYIRSWRGIPQLNMGDRCEITRVNEQMDIMDTITKKTVAEIVQIGGGLDITIEGLVVDIKAGSGIIKRCPQCNRSIMNGVCTTHGQVMGLNDLRLKAVIDDGTGAIGAVFNRKDTEYLTGISMTAAEGLAATQGEGAVARELTSRVLMKRVSVNGNAMSDDFGPSIIIKGVKTVTTDIVSEANELLAQMEEAIQ
jgi:replication factor A1